MRALLLVLDSAGVGNAPDAELFGDGGASTLPHVLCACPDMRLPTMFALGLQQILGIDVGENGAGLPLASFGRLTEVSKGKDSTTGHWELAGVIRTEPFGLFQSFPAELIEPIEREAGVAFLGNRAASGTAIIDDLGTAHVRTGHPILYTSADSVLQIAAHEEVVPVERLYEICRIARRHADRYNIGRVIARPFVGASGNFHRTARRHDFSIKPPPTILNALQSGGHAVTAIGKIVDLFAGQGITHGYPTESNAEGMNRISQLWPDMSDGFLFANLVDFDTEFGHRRDVRGYATALVDFDRWLGGFLSLVTADDLVIITADHGNDPTFRGTDHTREQVPLFVLHRGAAVDLGMRDTFADVAATVADFFGIGVPWISGTSFLPLLTAEVCPDALDDVSADSARRASARGRDDRWPKPGGPPEPTGPAASRLNGPANGQSVRSRHLQQPD